MKTLCYWVTVTLLFNPLMGYSDKNREKDIFMETIPIRKIQEWPTEDIKALDNSDFYETLIFDRADQLINSQLFKPEELPADFMGIVVLSAAYSWYEGSFDSDNTPYFYQTPNITYARKFLEKVDQGPILERIRFLEEELEKFTPKEISDFDSGKFDDDPRYKILYEIIFDKSLGDLFRNDRHLEITLLDKSKDYFIQNWTFSSMEDVDYYEAMTELVNAMPNYEERLKASGWHAKRKLVLLEAGERYIKSIPIHIKKPLPPPVNIELLFTNKGKRALIEYRDILELRSDINDEVILSIANRGYRMRFLISSPELTGWHYDGVAKEIVIPPKNIITQLFRKIWN